MNNINQLALFILMILFISCSGGGNKTKQTEIKSTEPQAQKPVEVNPEAQKLLNYLVETGDYVNGQNFPSLIKASAVESQLSGNIKIIDLRKSEDFAKGHIKGAANVAFNQIPDYFTNKIKPFAFDKIVIVCYNGQVSSYTTSLLRLMGYGNVYAMRWGMSSWNKDFATDSWLKSVSGQYENQLDTTENHRADLSDFPVLNTGKSTGEEIITERFNQLFAAGYEDAFISADQIFAQPKKFYIVNYERKDKYDSGHIPGAIRYKPDGTLGIVSEMESIPATKEIAVYCGTGHNSGFVTAYLRLFGYNAKALLYGNNAFMHSKMIADETKLSWLPFTNDEVNDFPYVKN